MDMDNWYNIVCLLSKLRGNCVVRAGGRNCVDGCRREGVLKREIRGRREPCSRDVVSAGKNSHHPFEKESNTCVAQKLAMLAPNRERREGVLGEARVVIFPPL